MDRGFVYVIAHIRGGQEMGRQWYEQGRLMNKMNTFTDFVDVTAALQEQGMIDPARTYAMGGSAGGLLMGAVVNLAPELLSRRDCRGAVRGCRHHHAGRIHPADHRRMERMGRPA